MNANLPELDADIAGAYCPLVTRHGRLMAEESNEGPVVVLFSEDKPNPRERMIELWFCDDCTIVEVNDDASGIESEKRERCVRAGLAELRKQGHILPDYGIEEFSRSWCDSCGMHLAGSRHRFQLDPYKTR